MLQICPKLPNQQFEELPFEEAILTFLRDLGHSREIKMITDVNVNKLHQPWRSFSAVINKCLSGKSTSYDSLRLSQAQILWGIYHKKNVDYAYLLLEDFVYQVENKNVKRRAELPKTKASVKKKQVGSDMLKTPLTKGKRLKTSAKAAKTAKKKQLAKTSKAKGLTVLYEVALTKEEQMKLATKRSLIETHSSHASGSDNDDQENDGQNDEDQYDEHTDSDNDGDDFVHPKFSTHDGENKEEDSFYPQVQTPPMDVNVNLEGRDTEMTNALRTIVQTTQVIEDTHVIITPVNPKGQQQIDVPVTTFAEPPLLSATTLPPPPTPLITHLQQTLVSTPPTVPSSSLQDLPNFGSLFGFDHRLKTLKNNFSEFNQTNQFAAAVSSIPGIVDAYLTNKMHEAVKTAVHLQSERLRDEAQAENADFLNKLDDNIKKIIKDQVKEQVKAQVSKILLKIEKTVNEQLKAEVLTRSSNESKTSHAVAANLSELELKKILIDKMESNKSIHRSDEQKNLYKALVDAYESDKLILNTYRDTVSFKRRRDDEDKEPSAGSNRGSKRRRAGKEPESTVHKGKRLLRQMAKSIEGLNFILSLAGESAQAEEPMHTTKDLEELAHQKFETRKPAKPPTPDRDWNKTFPDAHGPVQPWLSSLSQMEDPRESFNELMESPLDFSAFCEETELLNLVELEYLFEEVYKATIDQLDWNNPEGQQYPHDLRKPLPLIPNSRGCQVIPFDHFINNDLEYLSGGVSSRKYTTSVTKTKAADYGHIKWIEDLVPNKMWRNLLKMSTQNAESLCINLTIRLKWHNYKRSSGLVSVRRDDDIAYKFKEGDLKRLSIQGGGVKSYQKKLNLTKPDTYRLMRIDELHKFSDSTLNDVRTALDNRLKGIRLIVYASRLSGDKVIEIK
ncbi:hypothetical protein Tco_0986102 [Tanacetum coccineum]